MFIELEEIIFNESYEHRKFIINTDEIAYIDLYTSSNDLKKYYRLRMKHQSDYFTITNESYNYLKTILVNKNVN